MVGGASIGPGPAAARRGHGRLPLAFAACLLAAGRAAAWNNQGHMAVGEIAYDQLVRQDPRLVGAVVQTVAYLPQRQVMDRALRGAWGPARDRLTFAYLARWPDDIRGGPLDHPTQHYRLRAVSPVGAILPLRNGDAETAYKAALTTLRDGRAAAVKRAVALAWVFHIVGDMQQPLHAGTWLSLRFPATDRAGTAGYVKVSSSAPPRTLHDFWDSAADRPLPEEAGAQAIAAAVERAYPRSGLPELRADSLEFGVWADESARLARTRAYGGGTNLPGPTPASAEILSQPYVRQARDVAERRIAIGGYRLNDILIAVVPPSKAR